MVTQKYSENCFDSKRKKVTRSMADASRVIDVIYDYGMAMLHKTQKGDTDVNIGVAAMRRPHTHTKQN